jgi:3-oxoacyl-[acyl-carrier-protein] synthase-3
MIEISKIYLTLGNKVEKNEEVEKELGLKKDSIKKLTGINKRYLANKNQNSETLALKVCKKIKPHEAKKITHIISVTNTPSIRFPGISNYVSSSLNIENVFCINLNSGCTGYVDALILAYNFISNDNKSKILIVTTDTYSRFINKKNRSIKPLFSDGASVSIIKHKKNGLKFIDRKNLNISNTQGDLIFEKGEINMKGPAIVSLALRHVLPEIIRYSKNIDSLFIHQAGKIVINLIKTKLNKKIFIPTNYEKYGNLVSTSIPALISENLKELQKSKKILLCGFGVGLSISILKLGR